MLVKFTTHEAFRQRLVMATLSGKILRIDNIRSGEDEPGLKDFEVNLLRLLEKFTNGSHIEISVTGTSIVYKPGVIIGGKITHDCGTVRSIGYFLEPIIMLAPFAKHPTNINIQGITNDNMDISVDLLRVATLRQLKHFGLSDGVSLKILKRGAPPLGGGEINFQCPTVRSVKPIQFTDEGRIKRIRGIAYATRVSPQTPNRVIESVRSVLNQFIPDIYIYTDIYKGNESGKSPGYGLSLVAESTSGVNLACELFAEKGETPEDLGVRVGRMLLDEIQDGGCVDSLNQTLALLWMVLGPEDVSKLRIGKLTPFTITFLKDLQKFFNVTFKITPDSENLTVILTCLGTGFINVNKRSN